MNERSEPGALAARRRSFRWDLTAIAVRAVRQAWREPAVFGQQLFVPLFFFAVLVGSLEPLAARLGLHDVRAFQLPVAILIAVTGATRAIAVVTDITSGYFDRLVLSPVRRPALLLGLMVADAGVVVLATLCVLALGFALGIRPVTGAAGIVVIVVIASGWALAYGGILYAIAFRTANAAIMAQAFLLFFPFVFLTTVVVPRQFMTTWLASIASINPLTYVLAALRDLITAGWRPRSLAECLTAIVAVGVPAYAMALSALLGRAART